MKKQTEKKLGLSWYIAGSGILMLLTLEFMFGSFSGLPHIARLFMIAAIAMFVIIQSASYAVDAISNYAHTTGISDYMIGFVVVAIGTSFPDLSTAIFASLSSNGSLVLGGVIGACVLNLTLIIGLMAIVGGKLRIEKSMQKTVAVILTLVLMAVLMGLDGEYSRLNGVFLFLTFVGYMTVMILREGKTGKVKKSVNFRDIWKDMIVFGGTLAALLLSARWLVIAATEIAKALNIPSYFIGLVMVSVGISAPELIVGIKAVLNKSTYIGVGNSIGSVTMNYFFVLGIASIISPITFDVATFFVGAWTLLFSITLILLFTKKQEISWKHGIFLLLLYIGFIFVQTRMI